MEEGREKRVEGRRKKIGVDWVGRGQSFIHREKLVALFGRGMKDRASMVKRASPDLLMDSAL